MLLPKLKLISFFMIKMLVTKLLHRLNIYNYRPYVKILVTKILNY
jgi:hypothetical protein